MPRAVVVLLALVLAGCATTAPAPDPAVPRAGVEPPPPATPATIPPDATVGGPPRPAEPPPGTADPRLELARGQALLGQGEPAAAAGVLREALRREPDLIEARAALGLALHALGDLDAAVEELRAALRRRPDAIEVRLALARALVARQDWAAARQELEHVLAARPGQADAHYALGVVRYAQGDVAGAIEAYRRVLAVDPAQHDARFNLALLLRLARRDAEATAEFLAAARAGHPRAQYFAGAALAGGLGVEPDLAAAMAWWFRAAGQGVVQAEEALAQQRQIALGRGRRPVAERHAAEQAFAAYRASLWAEFPDLTAGADETVGGALLRQGRVPEAVAVLMREAAALSQPALRLLEALYEEGVEGQLTAHDTRILAYLKVAAAEGLRPPLP